MKGDIVDSVYIAQVADFIDMNGSISFGVIVAFIMYVCYFTQPLSQLAQAAQTLQSAAAAGERVFEFLEAEEMPDENAKPEATVKAQGLVEFSGVQFGYKDAGKVIISDFSFTAKPGQKIAIVGPTGAGKTTIINLLMRFHEISGGDIKIDGKSTAGMRRENVHSQFCMVLQEPGCLREPYARTLFTARKTCKTGKWKPPARRWGWSILSAPCRTGTTRF